MHVGTAAWLLCYHQLKIDLKYISKVIFPGAGFVPFTLDRKEKDRIYSRIFELTGYQGWSSSAHLPPLLDYLSSQAQAWLAPRHLFDSTIAYLSQHKLAIPAYSALQKAISAVIAKEKAHLNSTINKLLSNDLGQAIAKLFCDDSELCFSQLRQSAKNFSKTELDKELV